jgi:ADP-ribose pyrophosphatase YjhB (NUDIX family)
MMGRCVSEGNGAAEIRAGRLDRPRSTVIIPPMGKTFDDRTLPDRVFDGAARLLYRAGYRAARVWWRVRAPRHNGVAVLVRHGDRVLAVRHSYRPGYTVPGGEMGRDERPRDAAVRELAEETSIRARPDALFYRGKVHRTHVYELRLDEEPDLRVDHREIVDAVFLPAGEAARRDDVFRRLI